MPERTKLEDNPAIGDIMLQQWEATHCKAAAFKSAGISKGSLNTYLARGEAGEEPFCTFWTEWEKAEARWIAKRCRVIEHAQENGQWQAAAWDLERHLPEEFGLKQKHELTGAEGGPLQVEHGASDDIAEFISRISGLAAGSAAEGGTGEAEPTEPGEAG
jgi:hypothetical protein